MKKTTLLFFLTLLSSLGFGQVLNQPANWPNTNWTVTGTYNTDPTAFESDPTASSNFAFDDDDAGFGSNDNIAAESPVIDLTAAHTAGETWIHVSVDYLFRQASADYIYIQYWDADAMQWTTIGNQVASTTNTVTDNFCTDNYVTLVTEPINITGFTATQLSGFKYRIYFNDNGIFGWGFCFEPPTVYSATPPTCPDPTLLFSDNITNSSATIAWTEMGSATKWNIQYGVSPYTLDATAPFTVTDNPYSLTGLSGNTTYELYVQADCGGGDTSAWIGPISFTTLCDPVIAPYTEGFNNAGAIPSCWTNSVNNVDEDWLFTNSTTWTNIGNSGTISGSTASGGYLAYIDDDWPNSGFIGLLSPLVDVSALTTPALSFYLLSDNEGGTNATFSIDIFDGTSWTNDVFVSNTNKLEWTKIYIDLTPYVTGNLIQARFVVEENGSGWQDDVAIDDVSFDELPSCIEPIEVEVLEVSDTTAEMTLTQTGTAAGWNIEYGAPGFTQGSGTVVNDTTLPLNVTGLTPETDYEFYVQASCSGSDTSVWVGPYSFTTICSPLMAPFYEDFEEGGSMPSCWLQGEDNNENWLFNTTSNSIGPGSSLSQGYFAYVNGDWPYSTGTTLITPLVDVSSLTAPSFSFYYNSDNGDLVNVDFSVDFYDGTTWHEDVFATSTDSAGWQYVVIDLSGYTLGSAVKARFVIDEDGSGWQNDVAIDDVYFDELPSCLPVSNLSAENLTPYTADLTWTSMGTETSWIIEYGYAGYTFGSGTFANADSNPFTLTGLENATSYDYYMVASCGSGISAISGPYSFTTTCDTYVAPYTQDFSNGGTIPNCWEQDSANAENWIFSNSTQWTNIGNAGTVTGTTASNGYFAYVDDDWPHSSDTGLLTPFVDISGLTTPALTFYMISNNEGFTSVDFAVDFFDGTNWVPAIFTSNSNTDGWTFITIDLSSYTITGPVQAKFIVSETNGTEWHDDIAIDDVSFEELPNCSLPSGLSISSITSEGADLSWIENGFATSWNIQYGLEGFTLGSGITGVSNGTTATIESLMDGTTYDAYVQADCGSGTSSWVGPITFTTACLPFGDFTENFDTTAYGDVTLCWTALTNSTNTWAFTQANDWGSFSDPSHMQIYNDGDVTSDFLLATPALTDLPNATHRAKFMAQGTTWETIVVEVGTLTDITDPSTFTLVSSFNLTGNWEQYIVDFDTPTTDTFVAFRHGLSGSYQSVRIDDFIWTPTPTAPPVCASNIVATPDPSCGNYESTITWDQNGDADGYYLTMGTTPGGNNVLDNEDIGFASSYSFLTEIGTTYYFTLTPYNSFGNATGCTENSFTTASVGCYCESVPTDVDGNGLTDITIGTDTFTNDGSTYNDFTDNPTTVYQDVNTNMTIGFDTSGFSYNTMIWIDFNDNFNFEDSEIMYSGASSTTTPNVLNTSFTIPDGTEYQGQHLMRVSAVWSGSADPCYNGSWASTLDFMLDIQTATCSPAVVDSATAVHDCTAGTFTVDVTISSLGDGTPTITDGTNTWPAVVGVNNVGPFTYGTNVPTLSVSHGVNAICDTPIGSFSYDSCPPVNDNLCNATALTVLPLNLEGTTPGDTYSMVGATLESNEPTPDCFWSGINNTVWFSFIAPPTGEVQISTNIAGGTLTDTEFAVYDATSVTCTDLSTLGTALACAQDDWFGDVGANSTYTFSGTEALTPGNMYYIQLDKYSSFTTSGTFAIEVVDLNTSATESFEDFSFTYYPNPVKNNVLNISSQQEIKQISVLNLLGQNLINVTPNNTEYTVRMENLASGTYLVRVLIADKAKTFKIVKE